MHWLNINYVCGRVGTKLLKLHSVSHVSKLGTDIGTNISCRRSWMPRYFTSNSCEYQRYDRVSSRLPLCYSKSSISTSCHNNKKHSSKTSKKLREDQERNLDNDEPTSLLAEMIISEDSDSRTVLNTETQSDPQNLAFEKLEELLTEHKLAAHDFMDPVLPDTESDQDDMPSVSQQDSEHYDEVMHVDSHGQTKFKFREQPEISYNMYSGPDPTLPLSDMPCPGCGAKLHCQDPAIPGYMPSQKFKALTPKKLEKSICQRCLFLKKYNMALDVSVSPDEYVDIISKIGEKPWNNLILLVVDVMDMPNSIFPNLTKLIGVDKPIYIIGNKADLLPKDSKGYLNRTKDMLVQLCRNAGIGVDKNIRHVALVSAKTNYGIEELITQLMSDWQKRGDLYILGCTNVGKSTLFNALLSSDYCKSSARDFIQRATTCTWPGTTLNMLRFPVVRASPWRLQKRIERLQKQNFDHLEEEKLRKIKLKETKKLKYATLMGHVGVTLSTGQSLRLESDYQEKDFDATYKYNAEAETTESVEWELEEPGFKHESYTQSKWCYDTPGVINPQQVINKLTQEELSALLTTKLIRPRTFIIKPTQTVFVSGLGRLDYVKGDASIYFTVIASSKIPVHVIDGNDVDNFYDKHIGTETFKIPLGDKERLDKLEPLQGREIQLEGIGWNHSIADVCLSSLGWVAITAGRGMKIELKAFTPGGFGCEVRFPPLLPYAVLLRGKRVRGSPQYKVKAPKAQ